MADLTLVDSTLPIDIVNAIDSQQFDGLPAEEALTAGMVVRVVPSGATGGYITKAKATNNTEASVFGICRKTVSIGQAPTVILRGLLDGYNLDALDYWAPVYLSDTDGLLADAPGTVRRMIGRVVPRITGKIGVAPDKLLYVNCFWAWGVDPYVDDRLDDVLNTGDLTSDGVVDALRKMVQALGLGAAA